MGSIFSKLNYKNLYKNTQIDFPNATPSDHTLETFELIKNTIDRSSELCKEVQQYKNCNEEVRKAFAEPDNSNIISDCFSVINDRVIIGQKLLDHSVEVNNGIMKHLDIFEQILESNDSLKPLLLNEQALVYKCVHLLASVLTVDEAKLSQPALQNDLAFYRRILPKISEEKDLSISREGVNSVISFLAEHMPLTKSLAAALLDRAQSKASVAKLLAETGNGLFSIVEAKVFPPDSPDNIAFLRAMVLCLIAYDAVRPEGVFSTGSEFNVRFIVRFLQACPIADADAARALCNHIRYGCNSDNYRSAPTAIKSLFEF